MWSKATPLACCGQHVDRKPVIHNHAVNARLIHDRLCWVRYRRRTARGISWANRHECDRPVTARGWGKMVSAHVRHHPGGRLAGDWWPIAVLPILFGPGGIMPWILGGTFNNRPWIVAIANVLVLQFIIISALGASIEHFAMYLTFGPHVPGLTDSTTGRAAEQLYVSSSPQTWIPGLITAGIALMLAVIMAAVTGASSARQNGTAMNRLRIIAYVLSCLGFVALLIAICIMPASLRNKQTNILLAVLAFLTLVVWIPGIKRRSGGFRMKDPTSSDQESCRTTCRAACPDATPASAQRRRPARRRNRSRHGCGSRLFRYSRCHGRRLQSAARRSARRP